MKAAYPLLFDKLFSRTKLDPKTGCWEWRGYRMRRGYGRIYVKDFGRRIGDRQQLAHRAMYRAVHGKIPRGLYVLHECDNTKCVNPAHLRAGTQLENIREAFAKGRAASHCVPVICNETGDWFPSMLAAERELGVDHVTEQVNGQLRHVGGFTFRRAG